MTSARTTDQLIEAARSGEAGAVEELLARHEGQVYRFGLRLCGSEEDARDVLQETLFAAFRGLGGFRGEGALSTWLFQVARTHCLRLRRLRSGAPESFHSLDSPEAAVVASDEEAPDLRSHARQVGTVLEAAIRALPEPQRQALLLRDVEGLPAEDAARVVGIEVRALKSRLHRARRHVRAHLDAVLGDEARPG
ncbi:sigma-70 family RNA polymerase sigma factor [Myxococcus sp. K15C18031901]|uniref:RNA polymerase sigma factor n=1 Tax=Myxococcus dinghuensis TaxID=2906761 RepID=UPI0020A7063F|nr:sigma-70 family RNA polymerase sigma factor [Myxococcus dinghuensis]MCP3100766.1 sigma-70 family RNA polymerase sigma factor [Myxococcus dinghuensis]